VQRDTSRQLSINPASTSSMGRNGNGLRGAFMAIASYWMGVQYTSLAESCHVTRDKKAVILLALC
jgi:hypothetical protein